MNLYHLLNSGIRCLENCIITQNHTLLQHPLNKKQNEQEALLLILQLPNEFVLTINERMKVKGLKNIKIMHKNI